MGANSTNYKLVVGLDQIGASVFIDGMDATLNITDSGDRLLSAFLAKF